MTNSLVNITLKHVALLSISIGKADYLNLFLSYGYLWSTFSIPKNPLNNYCKVPKKQERLNASSSDEAPIITKPRSPSSSPSPQRKPKTKKASYREVLQRKFFEDLREGEFNVGQEPASIIQATQN